MTPYSLNPPGPSIQAGQNQLFNISPNNQDCRTFFNIFDPRQTSIEIGGLRENYRQDDKMILHDGSSSNCNSSFNISPETVVMVDPLSSACDRRNLPSEEESKNNDHGSGNKWMSSKMRLMKKMMRPSISPTTDKAINSSPRFQNHQGLESRRYSQRSPRNNNGSSTPRVCSDCNTSTTPLENEELHFAKGKKEEREAAHLFTLVLIAETGIARHLRKDPNNNTIRKLKLKNTNPSSYENKEYAIDYYRCGFAISGLYMVSGLVSVSSMEDIQLDISWDDVACPICLDFPHNSVLLHCSSYDKGCRAFVCDTNQLHSNCLDRFKNSCGMPSSPVSNATSTETTENSDDHEVSNGQCNLTCPLCRGEVSGWVIVDKARIHLDEKKRCCDEVRCTFMGSYLELQEHAQLEHPHARPSKIDPARQLDWENFQQSSEIIDVLSTIHSEIPRGVVLGDYVIEYGDDDARDEFEDFPGDEGNWWTSCILYFDNFRRSRNRRTRVSRTGRDNRRLSYDTSNSDEGSVVSMEYADYRIEEIDDDFVSTSGSSRGSSGYRRSHRRRSRFYDN